MPGIVSLRNGNEVVDRAYLLVGRDHHCLERCISHRRCCRVELDLLPNSLSDMIVVSRAKAPARTVVWESLSAGPGSLCCHIPERGKVDFLCPWRGVWIFGHEPLQGCARLHPPQNSGALACWDFLHVKTCSSSHTLSYARISTLLRLLRRTGKQLRGNDAFLLDVMLGVPGYALAW